MDVPHIFYRNYDRDDIPFIYYYIIFLYALPAGFLVRFPTLSVYPPAFVLYCDFRFTLQHSFILQLFAVVASSYSCSTNCTDCKETQFGARRPSPSGSIGCGRAKPLSTDYTQNIH